MRCSTAGGTRTRGQTPPFSMINAILQKVRLERATITIVVPEWPAQPWWPILHRLLVREPVRLPRWHNLYTYIRRESSCGIRRGQASPAGSLAGARQSGGKRSTDRHRQKTLGKRDKNLLPSMGKLDRLLYRQAGRYV